jgi:coenzyme F420-reducing hydrogenase beta subunit
VKVRKVSEIEIYRSSDIVLTIKKYKNVLVIEKTYYPRGSWGGKVYTYVEFYENKNLILAVQCTDRCKELVRVKISSKKFKELIKTAKSIKTVDDLNNLLEKLKAIESSSDREVENKINKLISKLKQIEK